MPSVPAIGDPPKPDGAASLDELITRLQALRIWTGMSYRELHRRLVRHRRSQGIAEEPAYATVYRCLQRGRSRLDIELMVDIVAVLTDDEVEAARWRQAYAKLSGDTATAYATVFDALPEDIGEFVGREAELRLVLDRARSSRSGVLAIEGMAGVGKTSLAVHAARRCFEDGQFDFVLAVNLCGYEPDRSPVEPLAVLDGFLRQLGEPGPRIQALNLDGRAGRYRELLTDRSTLVLLDNAASEDQVQPLLPDSASALVFVTSRHRVAFLPRVEHVELEVFSSEQAVDLLRRRVRAATIDAKPDIAARLVEQVGHLPLAVALLASRIQASNGWALEDHLEHLTERRNALRLDTGVELAFTTSYETLPPSLQRMLRLLALHPGRDCDAYAAAALAGVDVATATRQLADLVEGSLVGERVPGRYELHDLVRIYALGRARDEDAPSARRTALTLLFDHYRWAATAAMDVYAPEERDRRPAIPDSETEVPTVADRPAAIAWLEAERPNLIALATHATESGWADRVSDLSAVLARYLLISAHYDDAVLLHSHAARRAIGAGRGVALKNVAVVRWHKGDQAEAFDLLQEALECARAEDDKANEPRVLVNIGNLYEHLGRFQEAVRVRKEALKIFAAIGDRLGESRARQNLGTTYAWMGQFDEAVDHLEGSIEAFRSAQDPNGESLALENLGRLHLRRGDYERAEKQFRLAIAIALRSGNRLALAEASTGLGTALAEFGDLQSAMEHQRHGLSLAREIGSRASELYAHNDIGSTLLYLGRPDEAAGHHQDALAIARSLGDVRSEAWAYAGLARVSVVLEDVESARSHWQQALTLFTRLGMPEASAVSDSLASLDETEA